jgi:DNA topoisomerase-1
VNKTEGRFKPTVLGRMLVEKLLSPAFDDILEVNYTRELEEDLDKIEEGKEDYESTLSSFYRKFEKDLDTAKKLMPNYKEGVPPDPAVDCDKCGKPMVIKSGKFGMFLACSGYPECENTRELETPDAAAEGGESIEEECENCGRPMAMKRGRFGQFLACTGYPECKTTRKIIATKQGMTAAKPDQILDEKCPKCESNLVIKQGRFGEFTACTNYPKCKYVKQKTTGVLCPKDGGDIVEKKSRRGKVFYGCANYPDCDFTLWNKPIAEKCPDCGAPFLVEKITKRHGRQLICNTESCSYVRSEEPAETPA